jgi:DNA-binding Lrp family transcriptional regulator
VQTFILIHTLVGEADEVAKRIAELPDVETAEAVTGPYDVVVRAETMALDRVIHELVPRIHEIHGVTRTVTCPVVGHRYSWTDRFMPVGVPA